MKKENRGGGNLGKRIFESNLFNIRNTLLFISFHFIFSHMYIADIARHMCTYISAQQRKTLIPRL